MAFSKITLRKKWWQANIYRIYNSENRFIAFSERPSFFSSTLHIGDTKGNVLLELVKVWASVGNYNIIQQGQTIGQITRGWTGRKFQLDLGDSDVYTFIQKGWGKRIEINKLDKNVGLISSKSMSFNEVGVVVEDIDPLVLAACVAAINAVRQATSS